LKDSAITTDKAGTLIPTQALVWEEQKSGAESGNQGRSPHHHTVDRVVCQAHS